MTTTAKPTIRPKQTIRQLANLTLAHLGKDWEMRYTCNECHSDPDSMVADYEFTRTSDTQTIGEITIKAVQAFAEMTDGTWFIHKNFNTDQLAFMVTIIYKK